MFFRIVKFLLSLTILLEWQLYMYLCILNVRYVLLYIHSRLGMSVTTQGGSGRQCVTGPGRNLSKYRFVLLNMYRFWET